MRVLVIEDEPLAQEELVRLLKRNFPQMSIVATLATIEESVEWLLGGQADLIFMDIQLSDGVSFGIFSKVDIATPVIFITAYDQYAIEAFEVNGIGYLLKPINEQKLVESVNKFKKYRFASNEIINVLDGVKPKNSYRDRIAVRTGDLIHPIKIIDVAYFYAEERVTFVVLKSGRKFIVDFNIERLEMMLDPTHFFRLTRGCIASYDSIDKVSRYFNSRLKVSLTPGYEKEILVSRIKSQMLVQWLGGV